MPPKEKSKKEVWEKEPPTARTPKAIKALQEIGDLIPYNCVDLKTNIRIIRHSREELGQFPSIRIG